MSNLFTAFLLGGVGMYPILVTGLIIVVASIRYALDGEPIRLRFIAATAIAMISMMMFWTLCDVVVLLRGMYVAPAAGDVYRTALAEGLSAIINQWGLGLLTITLAAFAVAIGVYRVGARQLRALRP
jgi:hypothetical protein